MKNNLLSLVILFSFSCTTTTKTVTSKSLFEVLTQQETGGASIKFFEILSEENEIKMLLTDENLRSKISTDDLKKSNFVILNLGTRNTGGFSISIEEIIETSDKIKIKTKEISPKENEMVTDMISNPYTIIKINSKKEIIFE